MSKEAAEFATERQKISCLKIARRTRLYLDAMQALPNAAEPEQAQWLAWVAQYADHIDPTVDFTMRGIKAGKAPRRSINSLRRALWMIEVQHLYVTALCLLFCTLEP